MVIWMNKVLVKLYVPIIEEQYDVWIPINKKVYIVINLLAKTVNELSGGYYKPHSMPMLYDRTTGEPYDINLNVKENKIKNGTELILI